jgi:xanthine dehydrogenase accessory factor
VVVEDLEEMSQPERFPDAIGFIDSFDVADWKDLKLDDQTYVIVVTRDHAQDQKLLEQLIDRDLAYLGMIGSRRKVEMFRQRLEVRGHDMTRWAKLHAPIGLDIGAQSPEEIAVSIVGELIAVRARRRGGQKSEVKK